MFTLFLKSFFIGFILFITDSLLTEIFYPIIKGIVFAVEFGKEISVSDVMFIDTNLINKVIIHNFTFGRKISSVIQIILKNGESLFSNICIDNIKGFLKSRFDKFLLNDLIFNDNIPSTLLMVNFVKLLISLVIALIIVKKIFSKLQYNTENPLSTIADFEISSALVNKNNLKISIKDIGGLPLVKQQCLDIISFLKNRDIYLNKGVRMPKGVLFYGEPGTGKTMFAKAIAYECNIDFFETSGPEFEGPFFGQSSAKIRNLFAKARLSKKGAIIFIDEFDSIGSRNMEIGNSVKQSLINQLLTEMDGIKDSGNILVIGATNHINHLDPALIRPGRFDKKIFFNLPQFSERKEICKIYIDKFNNFKSKNTKPNKDDDNNTSSKIENNTKNIKNNEETKVNSETQDNINLNVKHNNEANTKIETNKKNIKFVLSDSELDSLIYLLYGQTGALIESVFNEAMLRAVKDDKDITLSLLDECLDEVFLGFVNYEALNSKQCLKITAIHEAGHAVLSYLLKEECKKIPIKLTIKPRGNVYGYVYNAALKDELILENEEQIFANTCILLGGYIAETIFFKNPSIGAVSDLEKVRKMANFTIGTACLKSNKIHFDHKQFKGFKEILTEKSAEKIESEVEDFINRAFDRTLKLLTEHKKLVKKLADVALKKLVLHQDELKKIFENYLKQQEKQKQIED